MFVCGIFLRKVGFESAIRRLGGGSVAEGALPLCSSESE